MEYAIGVLLALAVLGGSTAIGFDRERVFYPSVMIYIAANYILFATMGASTHDLILETLAAGAFIAVSAIGYKTTLWLVAAALAAHGLFDFVHHHIIANPGVPSWWPGFCLAFDVVAAGYLAVLIRRRPDLK